jgi:hypothetical protein
MSNGINAFRVDWSFMFVAVRNDGASVEFLVCNGRARIGFPVGIFLRMAAS